MNPQFAHAAGHALVRATQAYQFVIRADSGCGAPEVVAGSLPEAGERRGLALALVAVLAGPAAEVVLGVHPEPDTAALRPGSAPVGWVRDLVAAERLAWQLYRASPERTTTILAREFARVREWLAARRAELASIVELLERDRVVTETDVVAAVGRPVFIVEE